jgi:hypothetical protein
MSYEEDHKGQSALVALVLVPASFKVRKGVIWPREIPTCHEDGRPEAEIVFSYEEWLVCKPGVILS